MKELVEEKVFALWNSYRSTRNRAGKWKGCAMLDGFIKSTIRQALRLHGGSERVLAAITNYHEIWLGKEYKWTYAWTLPHFLTRTEPHDRKSPQIRRFLPGNFRAEDYLSESEKTRRAAMERAEAGRNKYGIKPMKEIRPEPRLDGRNAKKVLNPERSK